MDRYDIEEWLVFGIFALGFIFAGSLVGWLWYAILNTSFCLPSGEVYIYGG